jgi:hypothetical protein
VRVCAPGEAVYNIELGQILGFSEPIVLGVDGLPAGVTAEFDPDAVTPSALSDLTIRDAGVAAGSYSLTIKGQANQHYDTDTVILTIDRDPPTPTVLMTPLSADLNQPVRPIFSWAPIPHAESYTIEIAADPGFTDIVDKAVGLIDPGYVPQQDLAFDKLYYWRVRAVNQCGAGQVSPTFTFITAPVPGQCPLSTTPQTVFQDNFEKNETSWLKRSGRSTAFPSN